MVLEWEDITSMLSRQEITLTKDALTQGYVVDKKENESAVAMHRRRIWNSCVMASEPF